MLANPLKCAFDECESSDITIDAEDGCMTMMAMGIKGKSYNGNDTSIPYQCNKCGAKWVLNYNIKPDIKPDSTIA